MGGTLYSCGRFNKNYDLTNNAAFRLSTTQMDINYVASWAGAGSALIADEYHNRLIQIDGELYTLLLIRDDLTLMGIGRSYYKELSIVDYNYANRMMIFTEELNPIESTNPTGD